MLRWVSRRLDRVSHPSLLYTIVSAPQAMTVMRRTRASVKLEVSTVEVFASGAGSATERRSLATKATRPKSTKRTTTISSQVVAVSTSPEKGAKRLKKALEPSATVLKNLVALQNRASKVLAVLERHYPAPEVPLDSESTFQLLCAVVLSAQVGGWLKGPGAWLCAAHLSCFLQGWGLTLADTQQLDKSPIPNPAMPLPDNRPQGQHHHTRAVQACAGCNRNGKAGSERHCRHHQAAGPVRHQIAPPAGPQPGTCQLLYGR